MAYYNEFQQLILKLYRREEQVHHYIKCLKVGLNKDIFSCMTVHNFETIDGIFEEAIKVKREIKEKATYKSKSH